MNKQEKMAVMNLLMYNIGKTNLSPLELRKKLMKLENKIK
jgi:hypothetical protein